MQPPFLLSASGSQSRRHSYMALYLGIAGLPILNGRCREGGFCTIKLHETSFRLLLFFILYYKLNSRIVLMLMPSPILFRQFKEQLRQQRHSEQISSSSVTSSSYQRGHQQVPEYGGNVSMSSELEQRAAMALHSTAKATKTTSSSDLRAQHQQGGVSSKSSSAQQFDVKTMQKEAVLSYVKVHIPGREGCFSCRSFYISLRPQQSRQAGGGPSSTSSSPSRHVSGGGGPAAPRSRIIPTQVVSSNAGGIRSAASTSSIPTPYGHGHGQSVSYAARRDAEKSASAEAHLGQLRMVSSTRPPSK